MVTEAVYVERRISDAEGLLKFILRHYTVTLDRNLLLSKAYFG